MDQPPATGIAPAGSDRPSGTAPGATDPSGEPGLAEARANLGTVFDSSPAPMWIVDRSTLAILAANPAARSEFGSVASASDLARDGDPLRPGVRTFRRADRSAVPVEVTMHALRVDGRDAVLVVASDITERVLAEAALEESELRFSRLVENLPDAVLRYRMGPPGWFDYASAAITEITGYTPEEFYADPNLPVRIVHPDDREGLFNARDDRASGPVVVRMFRRDGEMRWVELRNRIVRDPSALPFAIETIVSDITGRMVATVALQESEQRYRVIFEDSLEGIFQTGADGSFVAVNPALAKLCGASSAEAFLASGVNARDMYVRPELRDELLDRLRRDGVVRDFVFEIARLDGRTVWGAMNARAMFSPNGELEGVRGLIVDVSERRRIEEMLRDALAREREAAERVDSVNRLKRAFLTASSHQLRTPLTSVLGFAKTLRDRLDRLNHEQIKEIADRIATSGDRLNVLLSELFDLERLMTEDIDEERMPVDLAAVAGRALEAVQLSGERRIGLDTQPVRVFIQPALVERAIRNLIENIERHTPSGTEGWVQVKPLLEGGMVVVDDAGPGVPDDLKRQIWDPFRHGDLLSDHAPGLGLGLAVVAKVAEVHGGRAWVEDRPGGGASFRLVLPAGSATG